MLHKFLLLLFFCFIAISPVMGNDTLPGNTPPFVTGQTVQSHCPLPIPMPANINTMLPQQIGSLEQQMRLPAFLTGLPRIEHPMSSLATISLDNSDRTTFSIVDPATGPTGSIVGRVTACGLGGIPDIRIWVYAIPSSRYMGSTLTDADGNYTVNDLPSGEYVIIFLGKQQGYLSQMYSNESLSGRQWTICQADRIQVVAPETTTGIDAFMIAGGAMSGRVVNQAGEGMPDIRIVVFDNTRYGRQDFPNFLNTYWTDSDGYYTLNALPSGEYKLKFSFDNLPYAEEWYNDQADYQQAEAITIRAPDHLTLAETVLRTPAGAISGRVTSDGSTGVSGIDVLVFGHNRNYVKKTTTNVNGSYLLQNLPAGEYRLQFTNESYRLQWYSGKDRYQIADSVKVKESGITSNVDINLQDSDGSISGHVPLGITGLHWLYAAAYKMDNNWLWWLRNTQVSDDGTYSIEGLTPGEYKVNFYSSSYAGSEWYFRKTDGHSANSVQVSVHADTAEINAVGSPQDGNDTGSISGRVTEKISGRPLSGITVCAYDENGNYVKCDDTDCYGNYSLTELAQKQYRIDFYTVRENYIAQWYNNVQGFNGMQHADPVSIGQDSIVEDIDAEMEIGVMLSGRVSDQATGLGVEGVQVLLYEKSDQFNETLEHFVGFAMTYNNGEYIMYGVPPGEYRLQFTPLDVRYQQDQWYADQPDYDHASPIITVTKGSTVTGIDAVLRRRVSAGKPVFLPSIMKMLLLQGDSRSDLIIRNQQ